MKRRYTAALVGLGRIAWRFDSDNAGGPPLTHMGSYLRNSATSVICGFSPVAQDRLDFRNRHTTETCERFDEVPKKEPDIVSICSPSEVHYEQTLACMDHRIPMVWLEKPPTLTLNQLDTLIRHPAYREGKTKVLVNYTRRYSNRYARLSAVYRKQLLGRPLTMQVLYSRGLELNGSHFLDLVFFMLGDQASMEVLVSEREQGGSSPTFILRSSDGLVVSVCGHETSYHINDVVLACEGGRVSVLSGGLDVRSEQKTEDGRHAGFYRLKQVEPCLLAAEPDDSFTAALADLIGAHETGRQPLSNLVTARNTQAVIERIRCR